MTFDQHCEESQRLFGMKYPKPHNSTEDFFKDLEAKNMLKVLPPLSDEEREASNARLEQFRRESIDKARRSEISASKVILNA